MNESLCFDYANSINLLLPAFDTVGFYLVGCGGTGGWLAPSIVRIAKQLQATKSVSVAFIDPDVVEDKNIPRQNFCEAEIGLFKAKTLALRYGMAWGMEIHAICQNFHPHMVDSYPLDCLRVIVGCVDGHKGRKSIRDCMEARNPTLRRDDDLETHLTWWLDCGNHESSGQVLLGSATNMRELGNYRTDSIIPHKILKIPVPSIQHPELLDPPIVTDNSSSLSCAEMAVQNAQSLTVNQMVANHAADFLLRLVVTQDLRKYATYFDLASGSARSKYLRSDIDWHREFPIPNACKKR